MIYIEDHLPVVEYNGLNTTKAIDFSGAASMSLPTGATVSSVPLVLTASQITTVSTSAIFTVGSKAKDSSNNEYIFLKGVASVVAGSWVSFNQVFETALLTTSSVGAVAVATAAVVASRWGWFQIYGAGSGVIGNEVSGDLALFASSVTGSCDDLVVTGDLIHGAFSRSASAVTGAAITVQLNYPFIDQKAGSY